MSEKDLKSFEIESSSSKEFISIVIADNGPGIPDEIAEKVLEPFFTTKQAGQGSGLGLSSVAGFAKQSGGGMRVYSPPAGGTSVELLLPVGSKLDQSTDLVSMEKNGSPDCSKPHEIQRTRAVSVLIVDDEPRIREIAKRWLQREGFRIAEAENAQAALDYLESIDGEVDILFSDIVMPGELDGFELANKVSELYPRVKILLATGYDQVRRNNKGELKSGSIPMLSKPYDLSEISDTFHAFVLEAEESLKPN